MAVVSASYVETFVDSLGLNPDQREMARVLLKTEECCKSFYIGFLNRNRYVTDDFLDYREEKLQTLKFTLDEFLDMCYNINMLEAMETCFLQPVSLLDLSLIDKAIAENRTTLEVIYSDFQKNPNKNILKNIL
jgi:hypothetical protein